MKASSGLVGRAADRSIIERRFDEEDASLVTLLGPPGIGKTALARAIADGREVVWVALDGVGEASSAADRIVVACGGGAGDAAAMLRERGGGLVVLDGVAPDVAPAVATFVERAPEAAFLVTARERMSMDGEIVHELGPLDTRGSEAVEVIVAAARRVAHEYAPRAEDVPRLVELARALEGIPLALELAGARLPFVGASMLAREPPALIALVVTRTVSALEPRDRATLAALSTFRSGFVMSTAAPVLGVDVSQCVELVERLRARALVRMRDPSCARLDLYRSVREAAARAEPEIAAAARARHAAFFVAEAEARASRAHRDADARAWLVTERDEIMGIIERVASSPSPGARDAEEALRATVALSSVLLAGGAVRGPIGAVAAVVSPLVERTRDSGADPRLSARVLALRGAIRRERGDVRSSLKDLLAADSIARTLGDDVLAADILVELGRTVFAAGEVVAAREHFDRAGRALAALGARAAEAQAIALVGVSTGVLGDPAGARALLERASALTHADPLARPAILLLLARACAEMSDHAAANAALAEATAVAAREQDLRAHGDALVLGALIAMDANDLDAAARALASARDSFSSNGLTADAAVARGWLGVLAWANGRAAEAYALLAEARDTCLQQSRPAHAASFGVFLARLDADVGRREAASALLEALATEVDNAWEHASAWPPPAKALVEAARGLGGGASLHARLLALDPGGRRSGLPPNDALLVGEHGLWFRAPHGTRVGLERRKSLALLLDRLASTPGSSVDAPALFAAAWPGERALASAAAHRVRVGVATLRKMGLRDLVVTTPTGYALRPDAMLVRV